jgi:transposase-like protein
MCGIWRTRRVDDEEREELQRLRREVRVLGEERDILKRAARFFAMETRSVGSGSSRRSRVGIQ